MTAFEEMGVMPEISQAVDEMDWNLPTDIQAESIPMILGGGDVLMAAETGSGKTGAFCLPVLQIVYETIKDIQEGKTNKKTTISKPKHSALWKMNVFDRTPSMAIDTQEGLLCQSRDPQGWHGARGNKGVTSRGKYYYEMTVTDDGLCRVGWSTGKASHELGCDREGFGFGGTGKKSFGKQFDTYGESFGLADVIGCYIDLDGLQIKWSKNGIDLGKAYDIVNSLKNSIFFPAICLKNAEVKLNFGNTPFKHPPKGGYVGLSTTPKDCTIESQATAAGASKQDSFEPRPNAPYAIIMEPSRELAEQTANQIKKFKTHLPIKIKDLLVVGGVSAKEQVDVLYQGVDIVVGTPGRMEDLISTGKLLLSSCKFFILDECDGLLSAGYGDLINRLHKQIPNVTSDGKRLQMIVCSATLHSFEVKKLSERLMHFPTWIDLKGQDSVPETVHHVVLMVDPSLDQCWKGLSRPIVTDGVHARDRINPTIETPEVLSEAVKLLKGEYVVRAIEKLKMDKAMLFCRTKVDCDNLEQHLNKIAGKNSSRFSCVCLHGDRRPQERRENLEKFKSGAVRFLICTDVAARGLDVSGLPYVVNVTMPDEKQNYVHRIGRVGRAERMGLAISLAATVKEKVWYHSNCSNRGKGCFNTRLTTEGGCCIWYDETKYLGEIEEHLGVTIDQTDNQFDIQVNEFDGKVTYGQKKTNSANAYKGHVEALAPAVQRLAELEKKSQSSYVSLKYLKPFITGF